MKQFGLSFVDYEFDLDNAIQTKAVFSYSIAVMDRIGGWEEEEGEQENWVGLFESCCVQRAKPRAKPTGSSN